MRRGGPPPLPPFFFSTARSMRARDAGLRAFLKSHALIFAHHPLPLRRFSFSVSVRVSKIVLRIAYTPSSRHRPFAPEGALQHSSGRSSPSFPRPHQDPYCLGCIAYLWMPLSCRALFGVCFFVIVVPGQQLVHAAVVGSVFYSLNLRVFSYFVFPSCFSQSSYFSFPSPLFEIFLFPCEREACPVFCMALLYFCPPPPTNLLSI